MVVGARTLVNLAAAATTYDIHWLSAYTNAVCNDGTPAGYYYSPGSIGSRTWLVYLAGGNWCYSEEDCLARCPPELEGKVWQPGDALCSSRHFPEHLDLEGVMSPRKDSTLGRAHKVFVMYCSSDGHMGDGESFGMQFRGARIVEAVFKDLVNRKGLGRYPGHSVIFGGSSAGARGAMANMDYVPQYIFDAGARQEVEVLGLLDSPLWIDIPPMVDSGFFGFRRSCRNVVKFANVTRFGEECAESFPEPQRFKCIMGQYRMPFMKFPYFMVASQFDSYQLFLNMGPNVSGSKEERDYMQEFTERTKSAIDMLEPPLGASRSIATYSPSCFDHARSIHADGWNQDTVGPGKTTMSAAVNDWLNDMGRTRHMVWADDCEGVACGSGCVGSDIGAAAPRLGRSSALALPLALLATLVLAIY